MLNTRDSQQKDLQITVSLRAERGLDKFDYSMPAFKFDSKIPGSYAPSKRTYPGSIHSIWIHQSTHACNYEASIQ